MYTPVYTKQFGKDVNITKDEVEQVFTNKTQYRFLEQGKIEGENVYSAYGLTDAGRYVTVIFIRKFGNSALIISARDMDRKERHCPISVKNNYEKW